MAVTLSTSYQLVAQKYLGNSYGNVYIRLYAKYSSQDVINNKTKGVTAQLRVYYDGSYIDCGVWKFTGYGNYYPSSAAVNTYGDIVQGSHSGNYRFNNGETTIATSAGIDVSHNADGTKSISMGCYGSFTSWGWEGSSGNVSVNLPAIDRSAPSVTQTQVATSATTIKINGTTNVDVSEWAVQIDGGNWGYWTDGARSTEKTLTVTEGTHTVYLAAKKASNNVWGYGYVATVYTKVPVVNFSVDSIATDGFTITATSDSPSAEWGVSIDGGVTYETLYQSDYVSSIEHQITGLDINTTYRVQVRVNNPASDLYGYSDIIDVKTQGGILHVKVGNTWKDVLAYVKVGNSWKQAIAYTKVGNNWRIGT